MQSLITIWLLASIAIAVSSFIYTNILTAPGQIFSALHAKANEHLPEWIFKPLIGCEKCNSGQLMLWSYIGFTWYYNQPYFFWLHIYLICQTIFNVEIIKTFYFRYTQETPMGNVRKKKQFQPPELTIKVEDKYE